MEIATNFYLLTSVLAITLASAELREAMYDLEQNCTTDRPQTVVKKRSKLHCASACSGQLECRELNFDDTSNDCGLYKHKALFFEAQLNCSRYKKENFKCYILGPPIPETIPSQCCAIPFTLNGDVYYGCTDNGDGVGCFYGDRVWKLCQQPADFEASYEETSTTALSANPSVAVPLLTINGWILMQRKVTGGSVSFNRNWAEYRDGFGSAAGNANHWLGLDKVYRLVQMGSVKLRVEIQRTSGLWYSAEYSTFSITDEVGKYQLTVAGYTGDAGNALMTMYAAEWRSNGRMFSTIDNDNDAWPGGACGCRSGWWYGKCTTSNINAPSGIWVTGAAVWDVQAARMLVKLN